LNVRAVTLDFDVRGKTTEWGQEGAAMSELEEIVPLHVVAARYGLAPRTVRDVQWRRRVGLPVVKLGGKIIGVRARDLAAVLQREFMPEPPPAA
jgi:hypothetical protein